MDFLVSHPNLLVAFSNLYGIRALHECVVTHQFLNGLIVYLSLISSFFYHLAETQKHHMTGYKLTLKESTLLNIDRFFAIVSMIRFSSFILNNPLYSLGSLSFMAMSELPYYFGRDNRNFYIVTHVIWHILAFHGAYLAVRDFER